MSVCWAQDLPMSVNVRNYATFSCKGRSCQCQKWRYQFTHSLWTLTCYFPIDTKTILICCRSLGSKDLFSTCCTCWQHLKAHFQSLQWEKKKKNISNFSVGCRTPFALHLSLWSRPQGIAVSSSLIKYFVQPWFEVQKPAPFNRQMAQGRFRVNQRHSVFPWDWGLAGGPASPAGCVMSKQQEDWYSASLQQLFCRNTIKAHCVCQTTGCNYICLPAVADLRQKTVFVVSSHCSAYLGERGCLPSVRRCLSFLSSEVRLHN